MAEAEPLPEHLMPKCWNDDTRMNALFAPFRLKSVNPESWEMKMKFWTDVLKLWCGHRKNPFLTVEDFKNAFKRKGRTPACIDIVVEENVSSGILVPTSKYMSAFNNNTEGWVRWGVRQAFKPAGLAVTALTSFLPFKKESSDGMPTAKIDPTEQFVCEKVLKNLANSLQEDLPLENRVGTMEDIMDASNINNPEIFVVIIGYLIYHGRAVKKGDLIKIGEGQSKVSPITEQEESLVKLIQAERKLLNESEKLAQDIERAHNEAKTSLKSGAKILAKNHLRKKHALIQKLERTETTLDNVRQLLLTVRQASTNNDILDTYKLSLSAIKQNAKDAKFDEDSVAETMDDLKEILDANCEIEKTLAGTLDDTGIEDLELELEQLLAEDRTSKKDDKQANRQENKMAVGSSWEKTKRPEPKEFVYDGEERMMAELDKLDLEDLNSSIRSLTPPKEREAIAVASACRQKKMGSSFDSSTPKRESKAWYPKSDGSLLPIDDAFRLFKIEQPTPSAKSIYYDLDFNRSGAGVDLLRDPRLHPGQSLDPAANRNVMNTDNFIIQDHKFDDGVWVYNPDVSGEGSTPASPPPLTSASRQSHIRKAPDVTVDTGLDDVERRLRQLRKL